MAKIVHVESIPSPRSSGGLSAAIWIAGLGLLLLWSLSCAALALLLTGGGAFLASQAAAWADYYPQMELAVSTGTAWLAHFGAAAMWILWGLGALLIVFGTWLVWGCVKALKQGISRLVPRASAAWDGPRRHGRDTEMADATPTSASPTPCR